MTDNHFSKEIIEQYDSVPGQMCYGSNGRIVAVRRLDINPSLLFTFSTAPQEDLYLAIFTIDDEPCAAYIPVFEHQEAFHFQEATDTVIELLGMFRKFLGGNGSVKCSSLCKYSEGENLHGKDRFLPTPTSNEVPIFDSVFDQ